METVTRPTPNCAFVYPATGEQCDIPKATHERKVKNHEFVAPAPQETPAQHSPLPWRAIGYNAADPNRKLIVKDNKEPPAIAEVFRQEDAALIVRCVNHSPAFQKLLEVAETLDRLDWVIGYEMKASEMQIVDEALDLAREALRLAREGEE